MTADADVDWWTGFFDDDFAALALRDAQASDQAAEYLAGALNVRAGATVFDQCCGTGRLGNRLAERGARVFGVDASAEYIAAAEAGARQAGLDCRYAVGDAFTYLPPEPCDAAFNWYTSFGYLEDSVANASMLARAIEALKPGGRFVLETINVAHLLSRFEPRLSSRAPVPGGDLEVERLCELDLARGVMRQRWTYRRLDGSQRERRSTLRLYLPHELVALLGAAGFTDITLSGGLDGVPCTLATPRCVLAARRPA